MMGYWEIYAEFYAPVRKFIAAMLRDDWTADDLVQETFLKVQGNLDSLNDPGKIKPWIFSIARNQCLDHFRQTSPSVESKDQRDDEVQALQAPLVQIQLEQREMSRCVQDKIDLLSEAHRTLLTLYDLMELSHQEIAETLGIKVGTAKVRLHRARKAMGEILERDCAFERDERGVLVCNPKEDER
jgi:RNA polymerase sigma-70 factor (ECF subfamily)